MFSACQNQISAAESISSGRDWHVTAKNVFSMSKSNISRRKHLKGKRLACTNCEDESHIFKPLIFPKYLVVKLDITSYEGHE